MTEETFTLPASWRRSFFPRRGGVVAGYEPVGGGPADPEPARRPLTHPDTPADLAAAGIAALDGTAEPSPLGVAALWAAVCGTGSRYAMDDVRVIADDWIARHGVGFAACTAVEFAGLWLDTERRYHAGRSAPLPLIRLGPKGDEGNLNISARLLGQVRAALAAAGPGEHAAAVEAIGALRHGSPSARFATSFLAPDRADWVAADVAEATGRHSHAVLLMASVTDLGQVTAAFDRLTDSGWWGLHEAAFVHTLAEGIGDGLLDVFDDDWSGRNPWPSGYSAADFTRLMAGALAAVPTDRAFQGLLDQVGRKGVQAAVVEAADRFPARAMRLLQAGADRPRVGELLRRHAAKHPGLAPERLRPATGTAPGEAPPEALPPVLAAPAWTTRGKPARPIVLDLPCLDGTAVAWQPGRREQLLAERRGYAFGHVDYGQIADEIRAGTAREWTVSDLFVEGPEELARPLLDVYRPVGRRYNSHWLKPTAARFGVDALPLLMNIARQYPADGDILLPFTSPEIALLMADWLVRLKTARQTALVWLRTHPAAAARALIPAALAKPGPGRRAAEHALIALSSLPVASPSLPGGSSSVPGGSSSVPGGSPGLPGRDVVLEAAAGYSPAARTAIAALLDADPLVRQLPTKIPVPPDWADPAALPPVRLRGGAGTLPAEAVRHVLVMLMLSKTGDPYAGLELVREACEPRGLARFGWELLRRWEETDAPPAGSWTLDAQAALGDDESAAALAEAVQRWPYEGAHKRAAAGLDVLAAFGSDVALRHLHDISRRAKARAVRARAEENLTAAAEAIGLTPDQLTDRLVPDFDLTPSATAVLDGGYRAGFDDQLKPWVADPDGTRRKDLPAAATEARRQWRVVQRGVRKVATEQAQRFEEAMVVGRRWTRAEFRTVFLEHPLMWHLARRLVWFAGDVPVRVAEDRTLADVADNTVEPPADAGLRVAHPVDLDVPAWSDVFADYGILQPFPQLGREVHRLSDDERAATRLARFDGRKALSVKLVALERRGWRREGREGGYQSVLERDLSGGRCVVVHLDPGIMLGAPAHHPQQQLADVWICPPGTNPWGAERPLTFADLDPPGASEILRDLGGTLE